MNPAATRGARLGRQAVSAGVFHEPVVAEQNAPGGVVDRHHPPAAVQLNDAQAAVVQQSRQAGARASAAASA